MHTLIQARLQNARTHTNQTKPSFSPGTVAGWSDDVRVFTGLPPDHWLRGPAVHAQRQLLREEQGSTGCLGVKKKTLGGREQRAVMAVRNNGTG